MQITISKKFIIFFVGVISIILVFLGTYYFVIKSNDTKTTAVLSAENSSNPIYYPNDLPVGYEIDKKSISTTSDVSSYTISSTATTEKIFVSIQPRPDKSVLDKLHKEQLALPETIISPVGDVVIGQIRGRYTASIVNKDNWILLTAPTDINYEDLQNIVTSFKQK